MAIRTCMLVALAVQLFVTGAPAGAADALATLQTTVAVRCMFQAGVVGEWQGAKVKRALTSDVSMVFHYHDIDVAAGSARMTGTQGSGPVEASLTPSGLTLTHQTPSGNISFTTVFPQYQAGTSSFLAVHSRHVLLGSDPLPAQYYGVCKSVD